MPPPIFIFKRSQIDWRQKRVTPSFLPREKKLYIPKVHWNGPSTLEFQKMRTCQTNYRNWNFWGCLFWIFNQVFDSALIRVSKFKVHSCNVQNLPIEQSIERGFSGSLISKISLGFIRPSFKLLRQIQLGNLNFGTQIEIRSVLI